MKKKADKKKLSEPEGIDEGAQLCPKCGSQMILEEGKLICPHCDGEIDFFGDKEE
ncbi:MAG: hypothetical protein WC437_03285 [Patescibacteria group bacterium]|jgi:uncharacterized Zn finger protein (UPF0148 family)